MSPEDAAAAGTLVTNIDYDDDDGEDGDDEFDNECLGRFLPEATVWNIASDLAKGLAHIHALGYVHLDMKPSNVFFAEGSEHGCTCKIGGK